MKLLRYCLLGLFLVGLSCVGAEHYLGGDESPVCQVCGRPNRTAMLFRVLLEDGSSKDSCCPRCGLHFQEGRDDVVGVEAADFFTGDRIDARSAFYLENSSVHLCCAVSADRDRSGKQYRLTWDRCMPSLLAFETRQGAVEAGRSRGGEVKTWEQLTASR